MIKWKRKKYRTSDGSYDRMLKKKWDAALETGLESGIFKHDHKGPFQILKLRIVLVKYLLISVFSGKIGNRVKAIK